MSRRGHSPPCKYLFTLQIFFQARTFTTLVENGGSLVAVTSTILALLLNSTIFVQVQFPPSSSPSPSLSSFIIFKSLLKLPLPKIISVHHNLNLCCRPTCRQNFDARHQNLTILNYAFPGVYDSQIQSFRREGEMKISPRKTVTTVTTKVTLDLIFL